MKILSALATIAAFLVSLSVPLAQTLAQSDGDIPIHLPIVFSAPPPKILIAAAHIDSAISGEPDEAILLWNVGRDAQSLAGWSIQTKSRAATFPITNTVEISPGQRLWCTDDVNAFRQSFGTDPACEWGDDTDSAVPNLAGDLQLANRRGIILLNNAAGHAVDALIYGDETSQLAGWSGPPAQLYDRGVISGSGQVWERKRDPLTDLPLDSDRATDWASDLTDVAWGRRVRFPGWGGWDEASRAKVASGTGTSSATVLVGPEGLYQHLAAAFDSATSSIDLSLYTLEHVELAEVLAQAAQRGVRVRILLEGAPAGGVEDLQRWCAALLHRAGAEIRYLAVLDEAPKGYRPRFRFTHAKYGVIDGTTSLVGTENFNYESIPLPQRGDVGGRRGFYLLTDAPVVRETLQEIFNADWANEHFLDLHPFILENEKYGGPPADFALPEVKPWWVDDAPFEESVSMTTEATWQVLAAPENALRPDSGFFELIQRAGLGDTIYLLQLYEHKHWGESTSNPIADPNPRLEALIDAARRGATVRLLLDAYFDDADSLRSNRATVDYVQAVALSEGLGLDARVGNPTGKGIHAKVLLIRLTTDAGVESWSVLGSLNGSEVSYKLNREVVVLTDAHFVFDRLSQVFLWDWTRSE